MTTGTVGSWGRFPPYPQMRHAVDWRAELPRAFAELQGTHKTLLPYGNGRSYGDSCLANSDHVLHLRGLDRLIWADWQQGVLRAEAGITLGEILQVTMPQGWFLPVIPGTKFVTLGGAVANDVHGKNHHHRGTFGRHVRSLGLLRSDRGHITLSDGDAEGLFAATIGGLGLTGIIEWVELQLMPIRSQLLDTWTIRFDNLEECFSLSQTLDQQHEYAVAWIDCAAQGQHAGRGIYKVANHSDHELSHASQLENQTIQGKSHRMLAVPFVPPFSLVNGWSLRALNHFYFHAAKPGKHAAQVGYEPFFFPLDRIRDWNRLYGPKGFQQYQCVVPEAAGVEPIREMLLTIAKARTGSFLAVLKRFGPLASPGLLSFPTAGQTLALDFPQQGSRTEELFNRLDAIVRATGGRLYPAKDAHMSAACFRACYPQWTRVEALRDPALCSRFWARVTAD